MKKREKIAIFGAGERGRRAKTFLDSSYDIVFFVDNDKEKIGTSIEGIPVFSPQKLDEDRSLPVIIASQYWGEILKSLRGRRNVSVFEQVIRKIMDTTTSDELDGRTIDLGRFLFSEKPLSCKELTFIHGGSGILDYFFLKKVAKEFRCKTYLEIGTYIGESINILTDTCDRLYSITAPKDAPYSMREWCKQKRMPDYSDRLLDCSRIKVFYGDSKQFDFSQFNNEIDLFFVDGDHSYNGVYQDTSNIMRIKKENSIVVWHDFKAGTDYNTDVVYAVRDVLHDDFKNVFVTNNNICGVYIPPKYQSVFDLMSKQYDDTLPLFAYNTQIETVIR